MPKTRLKPKSRTEVLASAPDLGERITPRHSGNLAQVFTGSENRTHWTSVIDYEGRKRSSFAEQLHPKLAHRAPIPSEGTRRAEIAQTTDEQSAE